MSSANKIPFANRILTMLNLIFGGAGVIIGIIGIVGYASFIGESYLTIPNLIVSILFLIFGFIAIGSGFSFIKGEKIALSKTKRTGILFLILFVLNTIFSFLTLNEFNVITETKEGSKSAVSSPLLLVSEQENFVISRKLSDIRFDEQKGELDKFTSVKDIVRWMITPMRVKKAEFEFEILDKIKPEQKSFIESLYTYDQNERVYLLKSGTTNSQKEKIIEILISMGYLRDYRIDRIKQDTPVSDIPVLLYMKDIEGDRWNVAYAWINKEDPNAQYYLNLKKYELKEEMGSDGITNKHFYSFEIPQGSTVYIKIDRVMPYEIRNNLIFSKLHVNKDNNLEQDDREKTKFSGLITSEPTITNIQKTGSSIILNVEWESEDEYYSELKLYSDNKELIHSEIEKEHSFIHKMTFDVDRDTVYDLEITYDRSLPFSLIMYILIAVLGLIYPILILIMSNTASVKEWASGEEIIIARPEGLTQIIGLNIVLLPFQIWLALGYLNGFFPSPPEQIWYFISGIIGVAIIFNSIIGVLAAYYLMGNRKLSKLLLKLFAYIFIIILLVNVVISFIIANQVPASFWEAVELLYDGAFASSNYIPRETHTNAMMVAAGIVFSTLLILIYPLYIKGQLKGENTKEYLNNLK